MRLLTMLFLSILGVAHALSIHPELGPARCRILHPVSGKQYDLSPDSTDIAVLITNGIAQVNVTQIFVNPLDTSTEVVYTFPLPHQGSVHGMQYLQHDSLYVAKIKEKAQALAIYDSVKQAGGSAGLLVQNAPNIFTQSLATLHAGDTVRVMIQLSMPLTYGDGVFEFAFPTMIGERYNSDASLPTYGRGWNPPANLDGPRVRFHIALQGDIDFGELSSPTHEIVVQPVTLSLEHLKKAKVIDKEEDLRLPFTEAVLWKTDATTYPNSDFVLRFRRMGNDPGFSAAAFADNTGLKHFMLQLLPADSLFAGSRTDLDVMMLIDISGSQDGWPLDYEKKIANSIIGKLRDTDRLCVMAFNNLHSFAFTEHLRAATAANREVATGFVNKLAASGGTELLSAILRLVAIPNPQNNPRIYVILTDGFITNDAHILSVLGEQDPVPTLLTFGAGNNLNRSFLDQAAQLGGGFSTEITHGDDVERLVHSGWSRVESAQLSAVSLDLGGLVVEDLLQPQSPNLFRGSPLYYYGKTSSTGSPVLTLKALRGTTPVSYKASLDLDAANAASWSVPKLWAREKIRLLELQDDMGKDKKDSIIAISLQYQVLSKYTAFLAYQGTPMEVADLQLSVQYASVTGYSSASLSSSASGSYGVQSNASRSLAPENGSPFWSSLSWSRSWDALEFTWDAGLGVHAIEILDLQGRRLYAQVDLQGSSLVRITGAIWQPAILLRVHTAQGIRTQLVQPSRSGHF